VTLNEGEFSASFGYFTGLVKQSSWVTLLQRDIVLRPAESVLVSGNW